MGNIFAMKSTRRIVIQFLAAALVLTPAAIAQKSPVRPAPTAADWAAMAKLPDLTGVWEVVMGGGAGRGAGRGAAPGRGGPAVPARPARPAGPALTQEYAAKAQAMARDAAKAEDNQTANCLPPGMPAIMSQPYPIEILMTPGKVTLVIEAYTQVRHIYTDARPLPQDPDPTFFGTSVGRWENNTLLVETVGFAQIPRGISFPYSDKMRITERFKLEDPDTLTIETTITDPEALKEPYSMGSRTLKRHRSWTIAEYICEENNRNFVDDKGKAGLNLAHPEASPR